MVLVVAGVTAYHWQSILLATLLVSDTSRESFTFSLPIVKTFSRLLTARGNIVMTYVKAVYEILSHLWNRERPYNIFTLLKEKYRYKRSLTSQSIK